jgi:hypothetical protein
MRDRGHEPALINPVPVNAMSMDLLSAEGPLELDWHLLHDAVDGSDDSCRCERMREGTSCLRGDAPAEMVQRDVRCMR